MDSREKFNAVFNEAKKLSVNERRSLAIALNDMSCPECEHWKDGICGKYGKAPPAKTIAFGCQHFEYMVPF